MEYEASVEGKEWNLKELIEYLKNDKTIDVYASLDRISNINGIDSISDNIECVYIIIENVYQFKIDNELNVDFVSVIDKIPSEEVIEPTNPQETEIVDERSEISKDNYGQYINYGIDINGDNNTTNDWRIFYKDANNNVYIIASDYVLISGTYTSNPVYKTALNISEYTGMSNISQTLADKFHFEYKNDYPNSVNDNIKAIAYLFDQSVWGKYVVDGIGEYAIGSPTFELFRKSWNEKFLNVTGYYQIYYTKTSSGFGADRSSGTGTRPYISASNYNDTLYNISSTSKCSGCWFAAPSKSGVSYMILVTNYTNNSCRLDYSTYTTSNSYGLRPVVILKGDAKVHYDTENTIWKIN